MPFELTSYAVLRGATFVWCSNMGFGRTLLSERCVELLRVCPVAVIPVYVCLMEPHHACSSKIMNDSALTFD